MKVPTNLLVMGLLSFVQVAAAYELPLQFTPNAGALGLVVAGYEIDATGVTGNCSYYTQQTASGRGGGYRTVTTYYDQTCRWDLYGALLSITPGAPAVPAPLYTNGTETIYSQTGVDSYTGTDSRLPNGGFVFTPVAHYTWLSHSRFRLVLQRPQTISLLLVNDGELPLIVSEGYASTLHGQTAFVGGSCLLRETPAGSTCSVAVSYDPTELDSALQLLPGQLTVSLVSNSGQAVDFVQQLVIELTAQHGGQPAVTPRAQEPGAVY